MPAPAEVSKPPVEVEQVDPRLPRNANALLSRFRSDHDIPDYPVEQHANPKIGDDEARYERDGEWQETLVMLRVFRGQQQFAKVEGNTKVDGGRFSMTYSKWRIEDPFSNGNDEKERPNKKVNKKGSRATPHAGRMISFFSPKK